MNCWRHIELNVDRQMHMFMYFLSRWQSTLALPHPMCYLCNFINFMNNFMNFIECFYAYILYVSIYTYKYIYIRMWKALLCWNQWPHSLQLQWNDVLNLCAFYYIFLHDLQAIYVVQLFNLLGSFSIWRKVCIPLGWNTLFGKKY